MTMPNVNASGQPMPVAPPIPRPMPGKCNAGVTPCGAPAQFYPCGWRCADHSPAAERARREANP